MGQLNSAEQAAMKKNEIEEIKRLMEPSSDMREGDCIAFVFRSYRAVELMMQKLLIRHGYEIDTRGHVIEPDAPNARPVTAFGYVRYVRVKLLPRPCARMIAIMQETRNQAVHMGGADTLDIQKFSHAFQFLVGWFTLEFSDEDSSEELPEYLERFNAFFQERLSSRQQELSITEKQDILLQKMEDLEKNQLEIRKSQERVEKKLDAIQQQLEQLTDNMQKWQKNAAQQLSAESSFQGQDAIMREFSDYCAGYILESINIRQDQEKYAREEENLKMSLGQRAWEKLQPASVSFLISAKIIYNELMLMEDMVDYSGVCVLVTKALELELSKRFCVEYLDFLKEKYPGPANFVQYPTTMLSKYGRPIREKDFTLGSFAYIVGYLKEPRLDERKLKNNREKLMEYCTERLYKAQPRKKIEERLSAFAVNVERIKINYRNPSAHTNMLRRINAKECFDMILDVEKFLKVVMESFS